jgi:hypothetical protein
MAKKEFPHFYLGVNLVRTTGVDYGLTRTRILWCAARRGLWTSDDRMSEDHVPWNIADGQPATRRSLPHELHRSAKEILAGELATRTHRRASWSRHVPGPGAARFMHVIRSITARYLHLHTPAPSAANFFMLNTFLENWFHRGRVACKLVLLKIIVYLTISGIHLTCWFEFSGRSTYRCVIRHVLHES